MLYCRRFRGGLYAAALVGLLSFSLVAPVLTPVAFAQPPGGQTPFEPPASIRPFIEDQIKRYDGGDPDGAKQALKARYEQLKSGGNAKEREALARVLGFIYTYEGKQQAEAGRFEEAGRSTATASEFAATYDTMMAGMGRLQAGLYFTQANRLEAALPEYREAARLAGTPTTKDGYLLLTYAKIFEGNTLMDLKRVPEAVAPARVAVQNCEKTGDKLAVAQANNLLGLTLQMTGKEAEALTYYRAAEKAYRSLDNKGALLAVLVSIAALENAVKNYPAALAAADEGLRLATGDEDKALLNNARGRALRGLGRPEEAITAFEASRDAWLRRNNPAMVRLALAEIAMSESDAGRHDAAVAHATEMVGLSRTDQERAVATVLLGNIYSAKALSLEKAGKKAEAIAAFDQAFEAMKAHDPLAAAQCKHSAAQVLGLDNKPEAAIRYCREVLSLLANLPTSQKRDPKALRLEASARMTLGHALMKNPKQVTEAEKEMRAAVVAADACVYDETRAFAYEGLAMTLQRQEKHDEAIPHFLQALSLFRKTGDKVSQKRALTLVAQSEQAVGKNDEALAHLREAKGL